MRPPLRKKVVAVHLNPVRAGLIDARGRESVREYPWSSVSGGCALPPTQRPPWLAGAEMLPAFDCADTASGRRQWVKRLDARTLSEDAEKCGVPVRDPASDSRRSHLRDGWYWGSQAFADQMRQLTEGALKTVKLHKTKVDRERRPHGEDEARRLVKEGMAAAKLTEADLKALPGSEIRKVAVAKVVWECTSVGLPWIAERLHMRSRVNASQQIRRHRVEPPRLPKDLLRWVKQSTIIP